MHCKNCRGILAWQRNCSKREPGPIRTHGSNPLHEKFPAPISRKETSPFFPTGRNNRRGVEWWTWFWSRKGCNWDSESFTRLGAKLLICWIKPRGRSRSRRKWGKGSALRIRVLFSVVYFSRGTLPRKKRLKRALEDLEESIHFSGLGSGGWVPSVPWRAAELSLAKALTRSRSSVAQTT